MKEKTLFLKLHSGMYIGFSQLGYIQKTRWFIPAKNLWAMLTQRITEKYSKNKNYSDYEYVGNLLKEHIRFTCFYFWTEEDGLCFPEYTCDGLKWGKLTEARFVKKFLGNYTSTAIDMNTTSAEENSLHELEYITPITKFDYGSGNKQEQVYAVGKIFCDGKLSFKKINIELELEDILELFTKNAFLGGESKYGYGRVELDKTMSIDNDFLDVDIKKDNGNFFCYLNQHRLPFF